VTGGARAAADPELTRAVADYRAYVERNTGDLVATTRPFVAAVIAGDVAQAKALYAPARIPYERIEPVAESFGVLDPEIDAREGDVPADQWGGFHKIEQALWVKGTAAGMAPVARKLLADVQRLDAKVKTVQLQAAQIANGANELLGEVSASKITGEEERYSHTDLVDFEANVDGAKAAYDSVRPILVERDPALAKEIEKRFADVYRDLEPYGHGTDFVSYEKLSEADTRKLARSIDALAEPLSQVPAQIVQ
jgi:iron uptake system EfeUOB component EfeO/EfeM